MSTEQEQRKQASAKNEKGSPDTTTMVHSADSTHTTWWLTGGSVLLVGAVVAAVVFVFMGGDDQVTPDPERVAELEASAEERHVDQVEDLIGHTRAAHDEVLPVLESLNEVLPADGSAPSEDFPGTDEVDDWHSTVRNAGAHFDHADSGETGFNITHTGLSGSVDLLGSALTAYNSAVQADGAEQLELLELAADLRDQAVTAWSVSATQLDVVSIEAGHGHIHLYLPAEPGSGALQPDEAEDGDEAHGDGAPGDGAPGHDDGH